MLIHGSKRVFIGRLEKNFKRSINATQREIDKIQSKNERNG